MSGDENGELKKLAGFVEAGFKGVGEQLKEVNEKLVNIEKERAFELGFEVKDKVKSNTHDIDEIKTWKTSTDTSIKNAWWLIKILIAAVVTLAGTIIAFWVNSHLNK